MPSFNFDIIIIIIVLLSIIKGYNRGLYRQVASTVSMFVPVMLIQIWGLQVLALIENNSLFISITTFLYKILKAVTNVNLIYVQRLLFYGIIFGLLSFFIKLIFRLFGPSKKTNLMNELTNPSKVIGSAISLIAAYFIIVIGFVLIKPITNIDEDKPLTAIVIKSNSLLKEDFNIFLPNEEE